MSQEDEKPLHLPSRTTPTWEMELLISGATIFGLLQLPSLIDTTYFELFNRSARGIEGLLLPLWMYAKFSLYTLILTFLVHLALRGYWIALVGLDSVYPGGVRWRQMRLGPNLRSVSEADVSAIAAVIEAADNRATRVFGLGFGLAMMMLWPIALVVVALTLTLALRSLFGVDLDALLVFGVGMLLALGPWVVAVSIDQRYGERWPPDRRASRWLRGILRIYNRLGLGRGNNVPLALFTSHEGGSRSGWIIALTTVPIFVLVVGQILVGTGEIEYGEFPGLPEDSAFSANNLTPGYYANQREHDPMATPLPFIPDRVARGPYLELFIPYLPRRYALAMAAVCPEAIRAEAGKATDIHARAGLDCLARMHAIQIDGRPVAVSLDAASDAGTGLRGMLAMIPIADLPAGRHELSLTEVRRPRHNDKRPVRRYRIAFWK